MAKKAASTSSRGKGSKRAKSSRRKKRSSLWPWLIGLGVVALIALPIVLNAFRAASLPGERFRSQGNAHIGTSAPTPNYNSNPPTSGPHYATIAGWGNYEAGDLNELRDELLVHNMEDGGVIMWYLVGSDEESEARLNALEQALAQAERDNGESYRRVVVAPREEMPSTYALTAWTRLQRMDEIDQEAVSAFVQAYEGVDHH